MKLFEFQNGPVIENGKIKDEMIRAYVWAEDEESAIRLYHDQNEGNSLYQNGSIGYIKLLLDSNKTKPFSTTLSDSGWDRLGEKL